MAGVFGKIDGFFHIQSTLLKEDPAKREDLLLRDVVNQENYQAKSMSSIRNISVFPSPLVFRWYHQS